MLLRIGSYILNTKNICFIDLLYSEGITEPPLSNEVKHLGAHIALNNGTSLYFWGEEAELVRWYFTHAISDVVDIKILKG